MNIMSFDIFISPENFQLAWKRVRYFDRPDSRDWIGLKVFAANKDHNLELIRRSVIEKTFEPSYAEVKYIPKPSLTQRPMAFLSVADRIVYQAIANVIGEMSRASLSMIENRQSFANVLSSPDDSSMFISWKAQYKSFQDAYTRLIREGNIWIAETDAAAFYETIDHEVLINRILICNGFIDVDTAQYLKEYLAVWGSVQSGRLTSRGVPQGCLASDLLANIFLYEFDKELAVREFNYLRYVDDIRLLGRDKSAVQRGLILIDMQLKSIGVLLQTTKTTIRRVKNIDDEIDRLESQLSNIDRRWREPDTAILSVPDPLLDAKVNDMVLYDDLERLDSQTVILIDAELNNLFWQSFESLRDGIGGAYTERHFRFCLYRIQPNEAIVEAVLPFLTEKPWLGELIASYLKRCHLSPEAIKTLSRLIETHDVYDGIVALIIEVLVKQGISLREHTHIFKKWLNEERRQWPLLCNVVLALGESSDNMSSLLQVARMNSPSVRRMALIQSLRNARNDEEALHICCVFMKDRSSLTIDALLYLMYAEWSLVLPDQGALMQSVTDYCLSAAKGYDESLPAIKPDYIRFILTSHFLVDADSRINFRLLLPVNYQRAAQHLCEARGSFFANPSRYISKLDLFHEELLYPILVDKMGLKTTHQELAQVEYSSRIEMLLKRKELPVFANAVSSCRKLRANPETHSRFHRTLAETSHITWKQRDQLKRQLRVGYQELTEWFMNDCPIATT